MAFKIEIGDPKSKKTFHLEAEAEALIGMSIGQTVKGEDIDSRLSGIEMEITGISDKAGFPGLKNEEGMGLRRVLLTKGKGMREKRKGIRLRKTVRGNTVSADIVQINLKVTKGDVESILKKEESQQEQQVAGQPKAEESREPAEQK